VVKGGSCYPRRGLQRGFRSISGRNAVTLSVTLSVGTSPCPEVLPVVGAGDYSLPSYSKHLFLFRCVAWPRHSVTKACSPPQGQLLYRHVQWFRGVLVFKAHRLLYHATLDLRVIMKRKKKPTPRTGKKVIRFQDVSKWQVLASFFPHHFIIY